MAGTSSLVVPIVMWGRSPPSHCVSAVYLLRDQQTLVTASYDGQVMIWQVDQDASWKFTPRHLLIGHTAPVRCIAKASPGADCHHIVTSSEGGEMSTWDTVDGQCLETKILTQVHTSIQAYRTPDSNVVRLFCCGFYEELCVIDPYSLDILFQLSSRINPDWVAAFHVLRPRNRVDDVVLALTTTGTVKVWTLNGHEEKSQEPVLENESKQIRCLNALSMTCCVYNMRTVMVVCATYWNIYDAGDFTCLLSVPCRRGERWVGGEFISADRVCCWSDIGLAFLYKLPTNCIVESKDFHNKSIDGKSGRPLLFSILRPPNIKSPNCPPAFKYVIFSRDGKWLKYLFRGDADGGINVWRIPDTAECAALQLSVEQNSSISNVSPVAVTSLSLAWEAATPSPVGVLDQLDEPMDGTTPALTSHVFLPAQCRLVIGREDGSIVLVPATQTIMFHLLAGKHQRYTNWPQHQVLVGHTGRVNCLLYPNNDNPRYDVAHLVSGGIDFSVCLWDIYTGTLLHRFSSHGGEVLTLHVPPPGVSQRIGHCVCGVASDHSVTLLSLKERRCVLLASRHIFPVISVKWRPLDDFLLAKCSDGSVYIWQMETGHLDRVVQGMAAEDVLAACDEVIGVGAAEVSTGAEGGANPAVGFLRGLRHRNLAAIKMATQRGMTALQGAQGKEYQYQEKYRAFPLVVNGFRTNPADSEGHIFFFDIEALIVQLLTEEYTAMSPGTMETQGLTNQAQYDRIRALTKVASPDTAKKITGFLNKVKDTADSRLQAEISRTASPDTQRRLTGIMSKVKDVADKTKEEIGKAKREFEERHGVHDDNSDRGSVEENALRPSSLQLEINLTLEIGQLLLSLLHAWGLDKDLDRVALTKLGLLKPRLPVSFAILSKAGYMSLQLPTWYPRPSVKDVPNVQTNANVQSNTAEYFTSLGHWELSHKITTHHMLSVIAITNTLMSVSNASFVPEQERKRKLMRQATHGAMEEPPGKGFDPSFQKQQEQIKQAWSLLSTLHCLILSGKLTQLGSKMYKKPLVENLAMRWQDRCLQVRLSAQELLVAELKNMGTKGRQQLVETWGPYLPKYGDPPFQTNNNLVTQNGTNGAATMNGPSNGGGEHFDDGEDESMDNADSSVIEAKRNQTTAVIICGVIGALFDIDLEGKDQQALGNNLSRLTAKALMYLVLAPATDSLPGHTSLRRAAIDLIGRGFVLWEPHLEVSKVLLGLLELCSEAAQWVPSRKYGLPLTPIADCCRTARFALSNIARVRPGVYITSVAREIARYNTLAANAQTLNVNLSAHVLAKSKAEVLHIVEQLMEVDTSREELSDLLVDVVDIILHCVDHNHLKAKGMQEVFPPISSFHQVSHCTATRRIAVGTKNGTMAMYELRASKVQQIPAHQAPITALAFCPDGKGLATYSANENKLSFWQTSTGMFGLGQAVTRCTKSYNTTPIPLIVKWNPQKTPKLVWISNRTVTLMLPDGTETRFNC